MIFTNNVSLKYFVPFKAQEGITAEYALKEKLLNIEGLAIDTSVNTNKWQVPAEDLDYFISTLINSQLRVDHAESALAVIGRVPQAKRIGDTAWFRAEIGDVPIIEKVLRGYLTHVSVQVDSDQVECSKCFKPTRKEGMLIHLCPGAWEKVHKPKVRELSIVASPAYEKTTFTPVGFAAAMNANQKASYGQRLTSEEERLITVGRLEHIKDVLGQMEQDKKQIELYGLQENLARVNHIIRMVDAGALSKPRQQAKPRSWYDDMANAAGFKKVRK